jgi:hypothetical protein
MDETEKVANEYLLSLARGTVVYEPDGNVSPDFLVNGTIAVEVRRLNQNEITESGHRGHEVTRIPLAARMRRLLSSFGPPPSGVSWFVSYDFGRPLPEWKKLNSALREYLLAFRDNPATEREASATICKGFEIKLRRASNSHSEFFVPGGSADDDTGGSVFQETQKNLRLCIEEKTRKIAPHRHKYPEWWLVLIDRIGFGVESCDEKLYREHLKFEHSWDKIVLVSPNNPRWAFELPASLTATS